MATVEQVWRDLHDRKGLAAVLDGLGGAFGTSLGNLPEFAIVVLSEDLRDASITVRGLIEARARVVGSSDPIFVTGAGVTTWSERVISSVAAVELLIPGGRDEVSRPILDGVVPANRIVLPVQHDAPLPASPSPQTLVPGSDEGQFTEVTEVTEQPAGNVQAMLSNTMMSPVEEAAVRQTEDSESAGRHREVADGGAQARARGELTQAPAGDHDNLTLPAEQVLELQAKGHGAGRDAGPAAANGRVARLVTNGVTPVPLDRNVIVGRKPLLNRVQGGHVPRLVTVPSPGGEVSGSHLELRVEDSDVLAVDLNSTNGSRLLRVGREPMRLRPGEEVLLVSGDRLDLGDGVVLGFEGLL